MSQRCCSAPTGSATSEGTEWSDPPVEVRKSYLYPRIAAVWLASLMVLLICCSQGKLGALAVFPLLGVAASFWSAYEWPKRNVYRALMLRWEKCNGESKCLAELVVSQRGVLTGKDTALVYRSGNRLCVEGLRANFMIRRDLVGELFVPLKVGAEKYQAFEVTPEMTVGFRKFDGYPSLAVKKGQDLAGCLAIWSRRMLTADRRQILPPTGMQKEVVFTFGKVVLRGVYLALSIYLLWFLMGHIPALSLSKIVVNVSYDRLGKPSLGPSAIVYWFHAVSLVGSVLAAWAWLRYSWRQYISQKRFLASPRQVGQN